MTMPLSERQRRALQGGASNVDGRTGTVPLHLNPRRVGEALLRMRALPPRLAPPEKPWPMDA